MGNLGSCACQGFNVTVVRVMSGIKNHEGVGSEFARSLGFSDKVCELIRRHVDAKRYLTATNKE